MDYIFDKTAEGSFEQVREKVVAGLQAEKFGVITTIDVQKTVKTKIDKDMPPYEILGACSPGHAFKAITSEEKIGAFLPCNVVLSGKEDNKVRVMVINPMIMKEIVPDQGISEVMGEVTEALKRFVENL